jgi:hypothetical protein
MHNPKGESRSKNPGECHHATYEKVPANTSIEKFNIEKIIKYFNRARTISEFKS